MIQTHVQYAVVLKKNDILNCFSLLFLRRAKHEFNSFWKAQVHGLPWMSSLPVPFSLKVMNLIALRVDSKYFWGFTWENLNRTHTHTWISNTSDDSFLPIIFSPNWRLVGHGADLKGICVQLWHLTPYLSADIFGRKGGRKEEDEGGRGKH